MLVAGALDQLLARPGRPRDADHRHVELAAPRHRLQRGKDLLVGEIAGDAEEDQRVAAAGVAHFFSAWPPKAESHRRQHLVLEDVLIARSESLEQCGGEHVRGHALVIRGLQRPASFARVRDAAAEFLERRVSGQRGRGQVEQPRTDHAAVPPDFGDLVEIEIVLIVLAALAAASFRRRARACDAPTLACRRMFSPSAYAAISPYSMPLWIILTKCPAPAGPQCR